jgi:hypothetical protein
MVCFAHKTQIMGIQRKTQTNLPFIQLIFYSLLTKVPIGKPKNYFFFVFFENHFLFPFLYFTFAGLNISN